MIKDYEYLATEYARVCCNIKYLSVLKKLETKQYKVNRTDIDNKLKELEKECDALLDELEEIVG